MLTQKHLKRLLRYDRGTGIFRWRVARGNAPAGAVAGYQTAAGHVRISINGQCYLAAALAFRFVTGSVPRRIRYLDCDRSNCRWRNLQSGDVPHSPGQASRPTPIASSAEGCGGGAPGGSLHQVQRHARIDE